MKITNTTDLGNMIRSRREELGYTLAQVSESTGLSVSFLSELERGKPTAQLGKTIQIINLLGLDLIVNKRGE